MKKKVIALVGAAAVLASVAVPALAHGRRSRTTWDVNVAVVGNSASATADTGDNGQTGVATSNGGLPDNNF